MKILANGKIKTLFSLILLALILFTAISAVCVGLQLKNAVFYVILCSSCLGMLIFTVIYLYFREQNRIMEDAVEQIKDFVSGNQNAQIVCDEEGDLYRLFHEVNSLVSILNAHAENEGRGKQFLKETISDISHQLKTPLAALNIYHGIIQEEGRDIPAIAEFASLSEKELDRIETLVQSLLKITKLDAGTIVMEKTIQNVSEMMYDIQKQFAYRAEEEEKTFVLSGDHTLQLLCDENWLMEAISNMVKNAFDHTKKGDTIRLQWRKFADILQITVSDHGSGIHPEDLPYIFKRFYRSRFSKDTQGIGLGLPLAKMIIEAHSGTIEADSLLGGGTTFTVNFLNPTKL